MTTMRRRKEDGTARILHIGCRVPTAEALAVIDVSFPRITVILVNEGTCLGSSITSHTNFSYIHIYIHPSAFVIVSWYMSLSSLQLVSLLVRQSRLWFLICCSSLSFFLQSLSISTASTTTLITTRRCKQQKSRVTLMNSLPPNPTHTKASLSLLLHH